MAYLSLPNATVIETQNWGSTLRADSATYRLELVDGHEAKARGAPLLLLHRKGWTGERMVVWLSALSLWFAVEQASMTSAILAVGAVTEGEERHFALRVPHMSAPILEQQLLHAIPQWTEPFVQRFLVSAELLEHSLDPEVAAINYNVIESMKERSLFTEEQANRILKVLWEVAPAGSVPPPAEKAGEYDDHIEKLKTLAELRDSGALTEAEFQAEKAKLLQ